MEHIDILHALKNCEFFKGLDNRQVDHVVEICHAKTYEPGECVFRQGDFGEYIYVIADGRVLLQRALDLGNRKGNVTLDVLGEGRVLGCWSTLLDEPHLLMSTAICHQRSHLLAMKGADLRRMMEADQALGFKLMERFCVLLRHRIQTAYMAMEKI